MRLGRNKRQKRSNTAASKTLFQKISLFFYDHPRLTAILTLLIFSFGILSYTTLLKREGFPSVSLPYSLVNGSYLVSDPSKVDSEITKPLSNIISKQEKVKTIQAIAGADFYRIYVQYEEGTNPKTASQNVQEAVRKAGILPKEASAEFAPLQNAINEQGDDILIAFYDKADRASTETLAVKAQQAVDALRKTKGLTLVERISLINPYVSGVDPQTNQPAVSQTTFDLFGKRGQGTDFYRSVTIGVKGKPGTDILKLDEQVQSALKSINNDPGFTGYEATRSYSIAPQITDQIKNLQQSLLEGLAAILVISAILIALRASLIAVSSMVLVITATLGLLYAIGYSLNVITLFSLVLSLSLIVDDTIIMTEAIDAQRRRSKKAREVISEATRKISRAMLAATFTAMIGFAPLIFVGGILGSFIKAIPITVISSLLISLIIALTFIPFMARFVLLRPKQLGHADDNESPAHHMETVIARTVSRPLMWIKHHRKREWALGITALFIGFGFIFAGAMLFQKVSFNIFAPTKDSDQLSITLTMPPNTSITDAEATTQKANRLLGQTLGANFKQLSYFGQGSTRTAIGYIDLTSFKERDPTSPELIKKIDKAFANFKGAQIKIGQLDAGPPTSPFNVRVETDDRQTAYIVARDVKTFMEKVELKRPDGSVARFKNISVANPDTLTRYDGKAYVSVGGEFDGSDTSALVLLAQNAIKKEYTDSKLAVYGLKANNISFDLGQESDNQDSFKTLLIAFPLLLVAIYILLISQFRSLLQPALIFMAIPFSFFGITAGLWLTDNSFSFFTMLGFFALIGLSIKNTILLTDYANQAKRAGAGAIDSIATALQERFRPLIATSLTAIFSLIPLYLSNPFWEGLAVTLMFGLLSSTFLVIVVFPYYYLGAEYLRLRVRRRTFGMWLILTIVLIVISMMTQLGTAALSAPILSWLLIITWKLARK